MGNKASSPDAKTENIQNSSMESSSGLHLFEVHFPTLGAGMGLVILGAIMLYLCMRRYRNRRKDERSRRSSKRSSRQASRDQTPAFRAPPYWPPAFQPFPSQPFPSQNYGYEGFPLQTICQQFGPRVGVPRIVNIEEEEGTESQEPGPAKKIKK